MSRADFISIQHVSKHFGPVAAVDDCTIDIRQGEFFSLLGPSGCGKTTLLRMLGGFETPTRGEIFIDGESLADVPAYHRPTNMVFQSYAIFPHLNVQANIAYGLRKDRLSREELRRRVDEMVALVKLKGLETRQATQLSGGQRQRVALARALIKRPKVLLLDEPLGALDRKLREEMQVELRLLQQRVGITFVFVTHDQEEALTMSDRVAVMDSGKVLQVAPPSELYERPNCITVASFIGQMNFLPAVVKHSNGASVDLEVAGFGASQAVAQKQLPRNDVTVALRPEKLRLGSDAQGLRNRCEATIEAVAYLGDRCHVHLRANGVDKAILVTAATDIPLRQGDSIAVGWPADAAVLLAD
jgi:spermidine/putrescine ABC transporter ATP-binding subunit